MDKVSLDPDYERKKLWRETHRELCRERGKIILIETGTHEVDIKMDVRNGKVTVENV